jgi:hypothetical protein
VRIEYDFLRVGSYVEPRRGHIYIDIGNQSLPGVIDTHGRSLESDSFACSSSLIAAQPSLVTDWITGDDMRQPIRLVMHENPDYDCIASSFLVRRLLEARAQGHGLPKDWNEWAPVIANSARRIDRGETRLRLREDGAPVPLTPYLSMMALHDQIRRKEPTPKQAWSDMITQGQEILDRALRVARDRHIADLNLVDLRGALSDLGDLERVIDEKMIAFGHDAARIGLDTGTPTGGELDGVFEIVLPWREQTAGSGSARIACISDPESGAGFFKTVIRGAYSDYIDVTALFMNVPADSAAGLPPWIRPIISVDPDSRFDIRGLGRHLDAIETQVRQEKGLARVGRPRPGFNNSDPWYDGRGFAFTIVDAPRWGTVLPAARVLREIRDSPKWMKVRVNDIVEASLDSIRRSSDAASRQKSFGAITQAIESWSLDSASSREPAYRECVDAVIALATRSDASSYERLTARASDVLLGLLRNDDPAVRADALAAAARETHRLEGYARACGRYDVVRLLAIVGGDHPEPLLPLLVEQGLAAGEELLIDAVTARVQSGKATGDAVLDAVISLATRLEDMPRARSSALHLASTIRGLLPDTATALETIARGAAHSEAETAASPVAITLDGVRSAMREQPILAAEQLIRLLGDAVEPERRQAVLRIAGELLERLVQDAEVDETRAITADALVGRMRRVCSAAELLQHVSEPGARNAARVSPSFIGILLHGSVSSAAARWALVAAALDGHWSDALANARCFVLTPDDARIYGEAALLTSAATGYFSGTPATTPCGTSRLVFLLLASARARGLAPGAAVYESLAGGVTLEDLAAAADHIRDVRSLLSDTLRHAAPDHFLLADAEPCLAKTEMFARLLTLAGSQETSPAGRAVSVLLEFAVRLPNLHWQAMDELQHLRRSYRAREDGELEALAQASFACAVAIESIREEGAFITDPDRVRITAAAIASSAATLFTTPLGRAVATALCDIAAVLDAFAGSLESTAHQGDDLDSLSLQMLQASTLSRFVTDWPKLQEDSSADIAVRVAARLAGAADTPAVRRAYSNLRRDLGRAEDVKNRYTRVEKTLARIAAPDGGDTVDVWYGRMRDILFLPAEAIDAAYARLVDVLINRYDIRRARHRIQEYSFEPPSWILRFCMSGWTVAIPLLYLTLFILTRGAVSEPGPAGMIDVVTIVLAIITFAAGFFEWNHKRRSARQHEAVESLRYKLFLPHYVVPVLIGVYTATISDEITLHMALQLDDARYVLLAGGFFAAATWALAQLIRRHGGRAATRDVVVAAGRLFAYGFVIALTLNLLLVPLLDFEKGLHERQEKWIRTPAAPDPDSVGTSPSTERVASSPTASAGHTGGTTEKGAHDEHKRLVPMEIRHTPLLGMTLFPRHILLDALFGMFIAIFLRGFWKMGESE